MEFDGPASGAGEGSAALRVASACGFRNELVMRKPRRVIGIVGSIGGGITGTSYHTSITLIRVRATPKCLFPCQEAAEIHME
jgi:hypothetical protein